MLYLEDYLEMIEHLPQELRDRFTQIREMDLQVNNDLDKLEVRVEKFFGTAAQLESDIREAQFQQIYQDYSKTIEDSEEKVTQAKQIYELIDKYMRRLDIELQKFKIELEADNAGITEIIEKRVEKEYEEKQASPANMQHKKKLQLAKKFDKNGTRLFMPDKTLPSNGEKFSQKMPSSSQGNSQKSRTKNSQDSVSAFGYGSVDGDSSYRYDGSETDSKNKKRSNKRSRNSTSYPNYPDLESNNSSDVPLQEWTADPTTTEEELFCVCRGISYGEMIQCENEKSCRYEWFHYGCVGMKQAPKGSWFCDWCIDAENSNKLDISSKNPEKKKKKREKSSGSKDKTLNDYMY